VGSRRGRTFPVMTVVDCVLLAVSVAAFGYLAVAMFKPEWF
jgi:K+-transporting ATPase KdpF subunit